MDDDELDQLLADLEEDVAAEVRAVLTEVADEFARGLDEATEIVAARFSVTSIARAWRERVPRLVRRLLRVSETAATTAADDVDAQLPDGWDNLPTRYDDDTLPAELGDYVTSTEGLLRAVGERLANVATAELADGLNAGETLDQLRARLRAAFAREGAQLGEAREQRIAATESTRAWNAATLGAAQALTGPDRPLVKQWRTRGDSRVRHAHDEADGQLRLLDETFTVGGFPMRYPGDPSAPADLTVNCRCHLRLSNAEQTAAATPAEETPMDALTAADGEHTGAMIALMPTTEDAERLAIDSGEPADQLHATLFYLGEATGWTPEQQATLIDAIREHATTGHVAARAFGAAHWNPHGDEPVWVWNISDNPDDRDPYALNLEDTRIAVANALVLTDGLPDIPNQYTPWAPHIAAVYDSDRTRATDLVDGCGPITFDRIRVAFAGEHTDIPLDRSLEAAAVDDTEPMPDEEERTPPVRGWTTPAPAALAFENQETGDGRIFVPDALQWVNGPWPLQYAEEMLSGHDGAELAGAIQHMERDGDRIPSDGVLYLTTRAGWEAEQLLEQGAPLGVSVDLDDVTVEFIDRTNGEDTTAEPLMASLASASVLRLDDGSWIIRGHTPGEWTASGVGLTRNARTVEWITAPGSTLVSAATVRDAFPHLTAAAGDPDHPEQGTLVHSESAGDVLMRITRARVRGATLVSVPAFADARIVLEPREQQTPADEPYALAAAAHSARDRVITYVRTSVVPVTARDIAEHFDDMDIAAIRRHLAAGVESGDLVRIARGLYVAATDLNRDDLAAAVSGATDLPIAGRDVEWDGPAAQKRVFEWATGEDGTVDTGKVGQAFLWLDPDGDPQTQAAWKLGFADLIDGELRIIPRGVFAVAAVLEGARGGADIPADDQDAIRDKVTTLYRKIAEELDDPGIVAPWDQDDDMSELEASAWRAMRELPPMPAEFFADPVAEGLLTDTSPGVNYSNGRIFGWVARAGEPHAGFPGRRLTVESLGKIDLTHYLRQRFTLDSGETVKAGVFTMNTGHHNDICETDACLYDDTKTVAGIVTVGMSKQGMWFSGAASPFLSTWDQQVFAACQPSYHMKQGRNGWQLRAVLSVPVPGHSTPLVAAMAAVVERSNLALTAAAALAEERAVESEPQHDRTEDEAPTATVEALTAALLSPAFLDRFTDALSARQTDRDQERAELDALVADISSIKDEITASAKPADEEA